MLIIGCRNDGNTSNGLTCIPRSSGRRRRRRRRRHRNGGMHTRSRNNAPSKKNVYGFRQKKKNNQKQREKRTTRQEYNGKYVIYHTRYYYYTRKIGRLLLFCCSFPFIVAARISSVIRNVLDRFPVLVVVPRYTRIAPDDVFAYTRFSASDDRPSELYLAPPVLLRGFAPLDVRLISFSTSLSQTRVVGQVPVRSTGKSRNTYAKANNTAAAACTTISYRRNIMKKTKTKTNCTA